MRLMVVQAQLCPACSCFEAIWDELLKIKTTIYAAHEELREQTNHAENRRGLPSDRKRLMASSGKAWFSTRFSCFGEYRRGRCGDTAPGIKLTSEQRFPMRSLCQKRTPPRVSVEAASTAVTSQRIS